MVKKQPEGIWHPLFLKGSALEDAGDIRGAIRAYRRAAKDGDSSSQNNLGNLLDDYAEPPRPKEAVYWYKRAIRSGDATAAWNLAMHYAMRRQLRWQMHWLRVCARMDPNLAVEDMADRADDLIDQNRMHDALPYLQLASELGDARAQNNLAILLETKLEPHRVREALAWYKKAAKAGSAEAARNLALHYRDYGDLRLQHRWLKCAIKLGDPYAPEEIRKVERQLESAKAAG